MELTDFLKLIKQYKKRILTLGFLGVLVGLGVYFLPTKYIASGSFFVSRIPDSSDKFFTYEGYYGQQSAAAYTNTFIGLLESEDLRSKALQEMKIEINENTLRRYGRYLRVKKSGPQLITVTAKGANYTSATSFWNAVANQLMQTSYEINKSGDAKLNLAKINAEPVVKETYRSLYLNITVGAIVGILIGVLISALKKFQE